MTASLFFFNSIFINARFLYERKLNRREMLTRKTSVCLPILSREEITTIFPRQHHFGIQCTILLYDIFSYGGDWMAIFYKIFHCIWSAVSADRWRAGQRARINLKSYQAFYLMLHNIVNSVCSSSIYRKFPYAVLDFTSRWLKQYTGTCYQ